nr:serine/threonine-protein kinase BLUS1-like isoform X1 [Ipomoea trifida]GMD30572.1 serine/threonine-protein kinase BLUS1-like [Ipomoea batatas]
MKKYPIGPENYVLYEEIGQGVSASVHRALCEPLNEVVAIKILDFERDNCDLSNVFREAQTMVLVDHPNVLKSHCSFVSDHNLWVIMPYMAGGSCLHILKAAYPDGFEEVVIATILREVLKGLEYLHHHGHIHRDVKAGNILIDARCGIKLGDFGVSACLFDSGDRTRMRNTFVGTPCWMAPEVMEQLHGYDCKADIWSFGITALELAHGHAPFSKYPPMKVLLMTLQNAPPGLDYERDKKFSKSFKQMIASCLVKDPSKRPSAKKLLKHSFFKQARSNDYIAKTLLDGLPALGDRIRALKKKEEEMLAEKKIPDGQKEEMSQNEYKRGISSWNFNLDDLKAQASLIPDEEVSAEKDPVGSSNLPGGLENSGKQIQRQLSSANLVPKLQYQFSFLSQNSDGTEIDENNPSAPLSPCDTTPAFNIAKCEKSDHDDVSLPTEIHDPQNSRSSPSYNHVEKHLLGKPEFEIDGKFSDSPPVNSRQSFRDKIQPLNISACNSFHQLVEDMSAEAAKPPLRTSGKGEEFSEKTKGHLVQQKGRFKVTSEKVDLEMISPAPMLQKSHSMAVIAQHPYTSHSLTTDTMSPNLPSHSFLPVLQNMLHANITERENILNLMRQASAGETTVDGAELLLNMPSADKSLFEAAHDREKELLREITDLQWRLVRTQEELQKYKTQNAQINS